MHRHTNVSATSDATGILVVVEGIDGSGKSTLAAAIAAQLESIGHPVVRSREPTDGRYGARVRSAAERGARLPVQEEVRLLVLDRREHVQRLILPALAAGKIVVLDRYYHSMLAYQGSSGGDVAQLRALNVFAPEPDFPILLDVPVDVALARITSRGGAQSAFEKRDTLQRCSEIFRSEMPINTLVVDGEMQQSVLLGKVMSELVARFDWI